MNLRSKYALVIDHGLFFDHALCLTREYGRVGYCPIAWNRGFATYHELDVGKGFDEIDHVQSLWAELRKPEGQRPDILIFPDVLDGELQVFLRGLGFRVCGSGEGDSLELYRITAKDLFKKAGLPVGPFVVVKGMNALREELKRREGEAYVKISLLRGITETFKTLDYWLIRARLDRLQHELGERADTTDFLIESAIPTEIEFGYDGLTADGLFPRIACNGVEKKDVAYACVVQEYDKLPKGMRQVNAGLAPLFKQMKVRGKMSTEIRRAKDGTPYVIDLTMRQASPAGECVDRLWTNIGEMEWFAAEGKVIEPKPAAKYAVQSIIYSDFADENWLGVKFPEKYRDNVALYYHTRNKDGRDFVIPQTAKMNEVGSVITIGDDLDDAIEENKKIAELIEGDKIEIRTDRIESVVEEFEAMEKQGIDLTPIKD